MEKVARALVCDLELDGIRGPSCVAQDLCALAGACRETRDAAIAGFAELATRFPRTVSGDCGESNSGSLVDLAPLAARPVDLTRAELTRAARAIDIPARGPRASVAARVIAAHERRCTPSAIAAGGAVAAVFAERATTRVPDRLRRALKAASSTRARFAPSEGVHDHRDVLRRFVAMCLSALPDGRAPRLIDVRSRVRSKFETVSELEKFVLATCAPLQRVRRSWPDHAQRTCECGQTWALDCVNRQCARCCAYTCGPCFRHRPDLITYNNTFETYVIGRKDHGLHITC